MSNSNRKTCKIGERFNRLVVLREIEPAPHQDPRNNYYELQCDCGNIATSDAYQLHNGRRASCGCQKGRWWNEAQSTFSAKHHWKVLKTTAAKRGRAFELTFEQYEAVAAKPCVYCGSDKAAVDRRDNTLGYSVENVQPCCKTCNRMKHAMKEVDFRAHLERIRNWSKADCRCVG